MYGAICTGFVTLVDGAIHGGIISSTVLLASYRLMNCRLARGVHHQLQLVLQV